jgi:hypothetical protein
VKRFIRFVKLAWFRLFLGETPLFFKYWGMFVNIMGVIAVSLTAKALIAPEPIKEKLQVYIWVFDLVVAILHGITPYMTTKNRAIAQDDFKAALNAAKLENKSEIQYPNGNAMKQ